MQKPSSIVLWQQLKSAAWALQQVQRGGSSTQVLASIEHNLRPAVQSILFHTLRHLGEARALLKMLASKPPKEPVRSLICVTLALALQDSTGEVMYTEFTLVSQAVEAVKREPSIKQQSAFVNALLRRFLRNRESLLSSVRNDPEALWNHPLWWIEKLRLQYPDECEAILRVSQQAPPLTLRVNQARTSRADLAKRWSLAGLEYTEQGAQGLVLALPIPVQEIPGFDEGLCTVQDAGAQLAAQLLMKAFGREQVNLQQSEQLKTLHILDACAAPGGKTTHLLEYPKVWVSALDIDAKRLERVAESCQRLRVKANLVCADAADLESWWMGEDFDGILLDAPCTASGIVRRRPDIRWLRRPGDVVQLVSTQKRLLEQCWRILKPGGFMLYCTCSVFKEEGELQIQAFLTRNKEAQIYGQVGHLLPSVHANTAMVKDNALTDHDGFFYTLLQKN